MGEKSHTHIVKAQGQNHLLDGPLIGQYLDRLIEGKPVLGDIQNQHELSGLIHSIQWQTNRETRRKNR